MAARGMASKTFLLMGQCLPSLKTNASRISVKQMVLDTNLNMVILHNFSTSFTRFLLN